MVLVGHEATVCCVGASALRIVSGGADKNIMIWSANSGTLLQTLHGHSRSVSCLHLGADRFASGGADGGVRLWKFAGNSQGEECVCVGRSREEGSDGSPVTSVASGNLELVRRCHPSLLPSVLIYLHSPFLVR
jgi:WD40 repeat protein